jgi:hypothetical protein
MRVYAFGRSACPAVPKKVRALNRLHWIGGPGDPG